MPLAADAFARQLGGKLGRRDRPLTREAVVVILAGYG